VLARSLSSVRREPEDICSVVSHKFQEPDLEIENEIASPTQHEALVAAFVSRERCGDIDAIVPKFVAQEHTDLSADLLGARGQGLLGLVASFIPRPFPLSVPLLPPTSAPQAPLRHICPQVGGRLRSTC